MITVTKIFYIIFGILTAFGGLMGYLKAGSAKSLIAGGACGVALITAALLLAAKPNVALIIGLVVCVGLTGMFLPKVLHHDFKPHVIMSAVFGIVGIVMTLLTWYRK